MKKNNKVVIFESKPTVGGFEKKNMGSPQGVGIFAPIKSNTKLKIKSKRGDTNGENKM